MPDWLGKVVLVTGGSSGLGKFIAQAFAERGANVAIAARDEKNLAAAAEELSRAGGTAKIITIAADVMQDDDVQRMMQKTIDEFGRLDVLVNNAG